MIDSALLHDGIGGKSGFDLCINGKVRVRDRAVPDIMVTFSVSNEITAILMQHSTHFLFIFSHIQLSDHSAAQKR